MNNTVTVTEVRSDGIVFSDGTTLSSEHQQDCCEYHYLDFQNLSVDDFKNMEFDLSNDNFFERVDGFGIRLKPVSGGHPVAIPGYGYNNGYYSDDLKLIVSSGRTYRSIDITECQNHCG